MPYLLFERTFQREKKFIKIYDIMWRKVTVFFFTFFWLNFLSFNAVNGFSHTKLHHIHQTSVPTFFSQGIQPSLNLSQLHCEGSRSILLLGCLWTCVATLLFIFNTQQKVRKCCICPFSLCLILRYPLVSSMLLQADFYL